MYRINGNKINNNSNKYVTDKYFSWNLWMNSYNSNAFSCSSLIQSVMTNWISSKLRSTTYLFLAINSYLDIFHLQLWSIKDKIIFYSYKYSPVHFLEVDIHRINILRGLLKLSRIFSRKINHFIKSSFQLLFFAT